MSNEPEAWEERYWSARDKAEHGPSPIELHVATELCNHNRVIRSLPTDREIEHALPRAREIIKAVRDALAPGDGK